MFPGAKLGDAGAEEISASVLPYLPNLKKLQLYRNGIRSTGATALACRGLPAVAAGLVELNLSCNAIGNAGFVDLVCYAFPSMNALEALNISICGIGDQSTGAMVDLLARGGLPSLKQLRGLAVKQQVETLGLPRSYANLSMDAILAERPLGRAVLDADIGALRPFDSSDLFSLLGPHLHLSRSVAHSGDPGVVLDFLFRRQDAYTTVDAESALSWALFLCVSRCVHCYGEGEADYDRRQQEAVERVGLLVASGADVDIADCAGRTPLVAAVQRGLEDIAIALVRAGAAVPAHPMPLMGRRQVREPLFHTMIRKQMAGLISAVFDLAGRRADAAAGGTPMRRLMAALLAVDETSGNSALDDLELAVAQGALPPECSLSAAGLSRLETLATRVPLRPMRLHLCGPGGAGKSCLKHVMLQQGSELRAHRAAPYKERMTLGVEASSGVLQQQRFFKAARGGRDLEVQIFDHGGQEEFQATYAPMLSQPNSVFIVVVPIILKPIVDPETRTVMREVTTPQSAARDLQHWLAFLGPLASGPLARVLVVCNVFDHVGGRAREEHMDALNDVLSDYNACAWQTGDGRGATLYLARPEVFAISCVSASEWKSGSTSLFSAVQRAMQELSEAGETMPALCGDLFQGISEQAEHGRYILEARDLRDALRGSVDSLRDFDDDTLDVLLRYAERCGRVVLASGSTGRRFSMSPALAEGDGVINLVITDPNWFGSGVLGELFRPLSWGGRDAEFFELSQGAFRFEIRSALGKQGLIVAPPFMVENLQATMESMLLCARVDNELWVPLFLERISPDELTLVRSRSFSEAPSQRLFSDIDGIVPGPLRSAHRRVPGGGRCAGRVLSLQREAWAQPGLLWQAFAAGTFPRLQAVLMNFYGDKCHAEPHYIGIIAELGDATEYAAASAQLIFEDALDEDPARVAFWVWATSTEAAATLLAPLQRAGVTGGGDPIPKVLDFMVSALCEGAACNGRGPMLFEYAVHPDAFEEPWGTVSLMKRRFLRYYNLLSSVLATDRTFLYGNNASMSTERRSSITEAAAEKDADEQHGALVSRCDELCKFVLETTEDDVALQGHIDDVRKELGLPVDEAPERADYAEQIGIVASIVRQ